MAQVPVNPFAHPHGEGEGGDVAELQLPPKAKLKKKNSHFLDTTVSEELCYLLFSLNQPLISAGNK